MIRRNFSTRARELSGGAVIVVSIPKSGRTWVRTFLSAYFCRKLEREFTLDPWSENTGTIPGIVFTHDEFEHRTKGDRWDRLRGKYLVPARELRRARIVLLARDPRDAFVSHYVQLLHRSPDTPGPLKKFSASQLMHHPQHGILSMIEIMNGWLKEFSTKRDFLLLRYEDLRAAPSDQFARLLQAIGQLDLHAPAFAHALAFSDFNNMKQMEASGAFASKILLPADTGDPESFKVRRGKIGGFDEYLTREDQSFAAECLRRLDGRFGYRG